jgi:hypothetical protein
MAVSSESRFFQSMAAIIGYQPEIEKQASDSVDPMEKIASMSIDQIMEDDNFLRGIEDRFAARAHEIDAAITAYMMQ